MKNIGILLIITVLGLFLLKMCGVQTQEEPRQDGAGKIYLDSPKNTVASQVEALSISNEIQNPVNTYLDSRMDNKELAKKAVDESNKRIEEQNRAMEALIK